MNRYRKKKGMIKGEHKKIKQWRKKHHRSLQLKFEQWSKDITPSIRF
jgi:tRNA G37 N-methylase TrmD